MLKSADERSPVATGLRREEEKQREVRALEAAAAAARAAACAELTCAAVSSLHEELSAAKYRKFVAKKKNGEQLTATRAYFQLAEKRREAKQAEVTKLQEEVILSISDIDETKAQIAKLEETVGRPAQEK